MGRWEDDELLGLTFVDEFNKSDPCYDFDLCRVMYRPVEKDYWLGEDSGCSCPSPFEGFTVLADWTGPLTRSAVVERMRKVDVEISCADDKRRAVSAVQAHRAAQ